MAIGPSIPCGSQSLACTRDEEDSWNAMHKALARYHRIFFERYVPVEVLRSRELAGRDLQRYKLIVMPYPLVMTSDEASALRAYVENGGHLFVEARPGWVNEDGHAEGAGVWMDGNVWRARELD